MHTDSGGSISQRLAQLCDKALIAEECTLKANQEEILCWYHYGRNFIFQEKALNDKNKIGEKKARSLIYDEVVKQLNMYRSYSVNEISKFTNDEIQRVIDYFTVKPNLDFTDDPEEQNEDNPSNSETNQINESDAQAIPAEVSKSNNSRLFASPLDRQVKSKHVIRKSDIDKLNLIEVEEEIKNLNRENNELKVKYNELKLEHDELKLEHNELKLKFVKAEREKEVNRKCRDFEVKKKIESRLEFVKMKADEFKQISDFRPLSSNDYSYGVKNQKEVDYPLMGYCLGT
ncbi:hypothetical protein RhiirA4_473192 [Rhizophagus irregularis]|uniref:Uncharacterized protein n=1 Tax=Rhizophagus irregularis TaxID=588596 RepID=A0A2I1H685_9GLOM|nr:hypothetical protein RhiirA4_473192 [Rhizophagus irregularis]